MEELVSVVVPVYNVEKYLDRCVQSIVTQTYPNLEIILVDDGSTDSSPAMCDQWSRMDTRIRVVHKSNAGLGMARNTGIEQAKGRFIFFFDSDDYVDLTVVEKCVLNARKYGSEIVLFGRHDIYDDVRLVERKVHAPKLCFYNESVKNDLLPLLFTYELGFGVSAWGKMFSLDTIRKQGLRFKSEREIISEDACFILELLTNVTIASIVPECLYYYCKRSNSLSRSYRKDRQTRNDGFLVWCMDYAKKNGLSPHIMRHIQSRYHGLTLSTLMQIMRSNLPQEDKREELYRIYHNETLHNTMSDEVLKLDGRFPRLFWYTFRAKCYGLCTLMLYANMYRK